MYMSWGQICGHVRRNGGDSSNIKCLSELNSCTEAEIIKVLKNHDFILVNGCWKSPITVKTEELKNKEKLRQKFKKSEECKRLICTLYKNNKPIDEIMQSLKVSKKFVDETLKEAALL